MCVEKGVTSSDVRLSHRSVQDFNLSVLPFVFSPQRADPRCQITGVKQ